MQTEEQKKKRKLVKIVYSEEDLKAREMPMMTDGQHLSTLHPSLAHFVVRGAQEADEEGD
jgi:hypothetical protein